VGRPRKTEWRILGPYRRAGRVDVWFIIAVRPDGVRTSQDFTGPSAEKDAARALEALQDEHGIGRDRKVGDAIEDYEKHRSTKGNRTVAETTRRLMLFFPEKSIPIRQLDRVRAIRYFEKFAARQRRVSKKGEEPVRMAPISVDYQRNTLIEARTFARWCVKQGWLKANPFDGIEGKGRRRQGKFQLHIDEARSWMAKAQELAHKGDRGAVAAMLTLLLGVRSSEVTHLRGRDLDENGALLWVGEDAGGRKTAKSRRQVGVPEDLRPHLIRLQGAYPGDAWLWGELHWRDWPSENVRRICRLVGVREVSAHSMRGLHSTLAESSGVSGDVVAQQLGHVDSETTGKHYTTQEGRATGTQIRAVRRLASQTETKSSVLQPDPQKTYKVKRE